VRFKLFGRAQGVHPACMALLQLCVRKRISLKPLLILDGNSRHGAFKPSPIVTNSYESLCQCEVVKKEVKIIHHIPTRHSINDAA
jgi:hypothetical protein